MHIETDEVATRHDAEPIATPPANVAFKTTFVVSLWWKSLQMPQDAMQLAQIAMIVLMKIRSY